MTRRAQKAAKITTGIKLSTKAEVKAGWRSSYSSKLKSTFYKKYTRSGLYGDPGNSSPLWSFMTKENCHTLSKVEQLRTRYGFLGSYFKKVGVSEKNQSYKWCEPETADHLLKDCTLCEFVHRHLSRTSLKPQYSKKSIKTGDKFLDLSPHLLNL
jgi:hypothetical protein